jgi:hypothetical protein
MSVFGQIADRSRWALGSITLQRGHPRHGQLATTRALDLRSGTRRLHGDSIATLVAWKPKPGLHGLCSLRLRATDRAQRGLAGTFRWTGRRLVCRAHVVSTGISFEFTSTLSANRWHNDTPQDDPLRAERTMQRKSILVSPSGWSCLQRVDQKSNDCRIPPIAGKKAA